MVLRCILAAAAGYLIGCISFGFIAGKLFKGKDIREVGSGNAGTANVIRNYGWAIGLFTFVGDVAKGIGAAFLGSVLVPEGIQGGGFGLFGHTDPIAIGICIGGLAAVLGHIWPVFLKFRGGKGVATSLGVFLMMMPLYTAIVLGFCIILIALTRTMSVGSLTGTLLMTACSLLFYFGDVWHNVTCVLLFVLVFYSHRANLKRLAEGKENQL